MIITRPTSVVWLVRWKYLLYVHVPVGFDWFPSPVNCSPPRIAPFWVGTTVGKLSQHVSLSPTIDFLSVTSFPNIQSTTGRKKGPTRQI